MTSYPHRNDDDGERPLTDLPMIRAAAGRSQVTFKLPTPSPASALAYPPMPPVPSRLYPVAGGDDEADDAVDVAVAEADESWVDWGLVAQLRMDASAQLMLVMQAADEGNRRGEAALTPQAQEAEGRRIIDDLLEDAAKERVRAGEAVFNLEQQQRLASMVFDAVFRLGRVQPLVDLDTIENIEITGNDPVVLEDTNGRLRLHPPVADTDEELLSWLGFVASRAGRMFSEAAPSLHLTLEGGARLAAVGYTTPRPSVVIRRHRLRQVTLDQLVARKTISYELATYLKAVIGAKKSIMVAGPQGAGKTTLVRALCACLDPWERIATFETEHELFLHELADQHRRITAFEARQGTGERLPSGRQAGEITTSDQLYDAFRGNYSRFVVGEVRGPEIIPMLKAMQSGAGTISTTHAKDARATVTKLVTCAMENGALADWATMAICEGIDVIVYITLENQGSLEKDSSVRDRYVTEVVELAWNAQEAGLHYNDVFIPDPTTGRATPGSLPLDHLILQRYGFDAAAFNQASRGGHL